MRARATACRVCEAGEAERQTPWGKARKARATRQTVSGGSQRTHFPLASTPRPPCPEGRGPHPTVSLYPQDGSAICKTKANNRQTNGSKLPKGATLHARASTPKTRPPRDSNPQPLQKEFHSSLSHSPTFDSPPHITLVTCRPRFTFMPSILSPEGRFFYLVYTCTNYNESRCG